MSKTKEKDLPLLRGCIGKTWSHDGELYATIAVYCPYCRSHHVHGWTMSDTRPQHRVAHCCGGPFLDGGYLIAPWPANAPESAGHVVRPGGGCAKHAPIERNTPATAASVRE